VREARYGDRTPPSTTTLERSNHSLHGGPAHVVSGAMVDLRLDFFLVFLFFSLFFLPNFNFIH